MNNVEILLGVIVFAVTSLCFVNIIFGSFVIYFIINIRLSLDTVVLLVKYLTRIGVESTNE